jgi:hypothetical protein
VNFNGCLPADLSADRGDIKRITDETFHEPMALCSIVAPLRQCAISTSHFITVQSDIEQYQSEIIDFPIV